VLPDRNPLRAQPFGQLLIPREIIMRKLTSLLLPALFAPFTASAAPNPEMIVVCYPAEPSMSKMQWGDELHATVVERGGQMAGEQPLAALFSTKTDECRKQIAEKNPRFVSPLGPLFGIAQPTQLGAGRPAKIKAKLVSVPSDGPERQIRKPG